MDNNTIRAELLKLLGQCVAITGIDPLCGEPRLMLQAAKETGQEMRARITEILNHFPKEK